MHIDKHIETVKAEMSKLEKQLCHTEELTVDAITAISGQMQLLENHLFFLTRVKNIVAPDKIQPIINGLKGKLSRI